MRRRSVDLDEFEDHKRQRVCSPEPVDLYSCEMAPSDTTLYFVFTTPQKLVPVQTPAFKPGDSVCRAFLNSLYPNEAGWYDRAKWANTVPVHVFRLGSHTAVVANVNRPGAVFDVVDNKLSDCDMQSLYHALVDHLKTRVLVLCQRRSTEGKERQEVENEIESVRQLVETYIPNPVLEFLSPGVYNFEPGDDPVDLKPKGHADFIFNLTTDPTHRDFEASRKFIASHKDTYAMVVYHTCPYEALFSLPAVAIILQPGGKVIQTNEFRGVTQVLPQQKFVERIKQVNGRRFGSKNNWRELVRDFTVTPAQLVKK